VLTMCTSMLQSPTITGGLFWYVASNWIISLLWHILTLPNLGTCDGDKSLFASYDDEESVSDVQQMRPTTWGRGSV
jgi:hypothetical protein